MMKRSSSCSGFIERHFSALTTLFLLLGFAIPGSFSVDRSFDAGGVPFPALSRTSQRNCKEVDLGTTLIAIRYDGGVVVAADTRTSVSTYVSHRFSKKIDRVSSQCLLLRSGSAADTQQLASDCSQFVRSRAYRYGEVELSVPEIAHWLRYQIKQESKRELAVSLIVAGYDNHSKQGKIFSIFSSGTLYEEDRFAVSGSGSQYIIGYLDKEFGQFGSQKGGLPSLQQARELCVQAVEGAIHRDGSSGGFVRMSIVSDNGTEEQNVYPNRKDANDIQSPAV